MIPALIVALSAPGLHLTWRLLRRPPVARDVALPDEVEGVRFGFDSTGLY